MAVYVDDASIPAEVRNGSRVHNSHWSHLTADTEEELHAFAVHLGLRREWFQDDGLHPHYDVTEGKRHRALQLGAQPIAWEESAERARAMREPRQTPPQKYLLFTSSRDGVTEAEVETALRSRFEPGKVLVAGGARGGDRIAARLWREWGGQVDEHRVKAAEWQRSRGAGYRRNAEMVAKVKAAEQAECVAVIARCAREECPRLEPHGTHGAVQCAGIAEQAGIPVTRIKAGVQPEADTQAALQSLAVAGVNAAELNADEQIQAETVAWHQWNQAVYARAAEQQAQKGEQDMLGLGRNRDQAAETGAEADRQGALGYNQQQARAEQEHEATLRGAALDAEIERLALTYKEYTPDEFVPWQVQLSPEEGRRSAELGLANHQIAADDLAAELWPERSYAGRRDPEQTPEHITLASGHEVELSAWDRYVTSQPGSEAHKAAYVDMHREAKGVGFPDPDPDRGYLAEHGYETDADRWVMPDDYRPRVAEAAEPGPDAARWGLDLFGTKRDRDPLPRVLAPEESAEPTPPPSKLPDGTPHPNLFLAERGWETQGGWYVRQRETDREPGA